MASINASTSSGVITTADNTGILNLQSNGTTVATISPTGFNLPSANTLNAANTFGFKNRIINGAMVIDQRNVGASVNPTDGQYCIDRWLLFTSQASKYTAQQNAGSVTPPAGFTNYLGITSSSSYSITSSDYFIVEQKLEGFNVADLNWGSANAKTVTLSFWVRSSLTGTFGGVLKNSAGNRSYPFTYTISAANTWEYETITIVGDTTGTWVTNNGTGIRLQFGLGVGSSLSGTAGAWAAASYASATGATSVVGTNGATFYITGVQFEVGTQATSFDFRSYGTELALCQRYYQEVGAAAANEYIYSFYGITGNTYYIPSPLPVPMRAAPTATIAGTWNFANVSSFTIAASYNAYRLNIAASATANITVQNTGTGSKLTFAIEL